MHCFVANSALWQARVGEVMEKTKVCIASKKKRSESFNINFITTETGKRLKLKWFTMKDPIF